MALYLWRVPVRCICVVYMNTRFRRRLDYNRYRYYCAQEWHVDLATWCLVDQDKVKVQAKYALRPRLEIDCLA